MARVEEEGQEHDGRPGEAARHVADGRELRRAPNTIMLIAIASIGENPASRAARP